MFTSRAEYRILLRQDNADERLTPIGIEIGLASETRKQRFLKKRKSLDSLSKYLQKTSISPEQANPILRSIGSAEMKQKQKAGTLLSRPQVKFEHLAQILPSLQEEPKEIQESVEIRIKYEGYIKKEQDMASKLKRLDGISIPGDFDYAAITSLSAESREKLAREKPATLAAASNISGVSASDLSVLLIHMGR
jgi:tRNA uridine 5-carboxymethylaminomethyl modification enzyme